MPDSIPPAQEHNVDEEFSRDSPDPIQETLDALHDIMSVLDTTHPKLAGRVEGLLKVADDPRKAGRLSFHHDVAYLAQDVEKATSTILATSHTTRVDMVRLASSAPGLQNERMLALLRATPDLPDQQLVDQIRATGLRIGLNADQHTPNFKSEIEALEHRVRQTQGLGVSTNPSPDKPFSRQPDHPPPPFREPPSDTNARRDEVDATNNAARQLPSNNGGQPSRPQQQQVTFKSGIFGDIMRALRPTDQGNGAPWDPLPTPLQDRLTRFEQSMVQGRDDIALRTAEQAGRAALDALNAFRNSEGAAVINRIEEAGRHNGGIAEVLAEMRQGGRFADLRQQFNNAFAADRGFAASYEKAAGALAAYGQARTDIGQILGKRNDAGLAARFEQMDGEIGKAAGEMPSRRDGKNMVDDLTKQLAELFHRTVEGLRNMFGGARAGSRPGPSPSP